MSFSPPSVTTLCQIAVIQRTDYFVNGNSNALYRYQTLEAHSTLLHVLCSCVSLWHIMVPKIYEAAKVIAVGVTRNIVILHRALYSLTLVTKRS